MLSEFDLIKEYFQRPHHATRAVLGIGDDCALIAPTPGMQTAISSDMLVEGRHFFAGEDARRLGHKSLAVNLSDLAAMGARPVGFTLALALPAADRAWLQGFAQGLFALADAFNIELIGGDTTKGPLNICITVFGEIPPGQALLRSGAQAGDDVYVSGTVGDARLALEVFRSTLTLQGDEFESVRKAMELPQPRVALGAALRGVATSAIDVSDGLVGDLKHILKRSNVGATLDVDTLPRSKILAAQPIATQRTCTLAGGDDYELIFTAPSRHSDAVQQAALRSKVQVTRIGRIDAAPGLRLIDTSGTAVDNTFESFDHFRS